MTFEATRALLLIGVVRAFGMVSHVQQSVRRMAKRTMKQFQEAWEVWNTSLNMRTWSFLEKAILCFASHYSLLLIDLAADQRGSGFILAVSLHFCFHTSILPHFSLHSSHSFFYFDIKTMRPLAPL